MAQHVVVVEELRCAAIREPDLETAGLRHGFVPDDANARRRDIKADPSPREGPQPSCLRVNEPGPLLDDAGASIAPPPNLREMIGIVP